MPRFGSGDDLRGGIEQAATNVKQRRPTIDWTAIRGMRIRLAHAYLAIDPVVEQAITPDLDHLYPAMSSEVPDWKQRDGCGK